MECRPSKWILTEAQKNFKEDYKQAKITKKPRMEKYQQSSSKDLNSKRHAFTENHKNKIQQMTGCIHRTQNPKNSKIAVLKTD